MRRLRILAVIVTPLLLASIALAQPQVEIVTNDLDPDKVDALIAEVGDSLTSAQSLHKLKTAVQMAKKIDYHEGAVLGYETILKGQRELDEGNGELRYLLEFINYLRKKASGGKLLAQKHYEAGQIYFRYGVYNKAASAYKDAIDALEDPYDELKFPATKRLAWSHQLDGDHDSARDVYRNALNMSREANQPTETLWILQQLARMRHLETKYEAEVRLLRKAFDLADSLDLRQERIIALNNLAYGLKYQNDYEAAQASFESVLNEVFKDDEAQAVVYQNLGILHQNKGDLDLATNAFLKAAEFHRKAKNHREEALMYDLLAMVYYQRNDMYNASVYNGQSLELAKRKNHPDVLQSAYRTKSLIHQELYEFEEALESFKTHLLIQDSLNAVERDRMASIKQEQEFVEVLETELNLLWVSEEVKDLQIANLLAENKLAEERQKALEKEAELNAAEAAYQRVKARENLNKAMLAEQQLKAQQEKARAEKAASDAKWAKLEAEQAEEELARERLARMNREKQIETEKAKVAAEQAAFRNLMGVLVLVCLSLVVAAIAYRQVRKKNKQIAAQNAVIASERDKSDKLLLNILPPTVAAELKDKGSTTPHFYESVSVVFTDFSGFTTISEKLSPAELVQTLDKVFLEFDLIAERCGLNRIKTIGDAYMAACGLPEADPDHARKSVEAALAMRDFIANFNKTLEPGQPQWNVRIGVNTGPVVAGVVGIKKFAYDIWGDAVNVASRMESSGTIGKVNISETTYALVKDDFKTEYRGKVMAKNKGEIDMYFVEA